MNTESLREWLKTHMDNEEAILKALLYECYARHVDTHKPWPKADGEERKIGRTRILGLWELLELYGKSPKELGQLWGVSKAQTYKILGWRCSPSLAQTIQVLEFFDIPRLYVQYKDGDEPQGDIFTIVSIPLQCKKVS